MQQRSIPDILPLGNRKRIKCGKQPNTILNGGVTCVSVLHMFTLVMLSECLFVFQEDEVNRLGFFSKQKNAESEWEIIYCV